MKFDLKKLLENLQPVPISEKIFFADRLRVMIKAGLSLSQALDTLESESRNPRFKKILGELRDAVERGEQFSGVLDKYPKLFSTFFRSMIRVGEVAGTLEKNLQELGNQMHKDHALLSKIRGALTYPIVVLAATVLILVGLFTYVLPNILSVFSSFQAQLPLPTRILVALSSAFSKYGLYIFIVTVAVIVALTWFFKTRGKKFWHAFLLRFLIIGPIIQKVNLARFSRTLSSLLNTDIPIVQSLEVTADVLGNIHYKSAALRAAEELKKGVPISEILKQNSRLFPPLVTTMIAVGEKSGTTDDMLREIAEFYEADVDQITKNLSTVIEPLLILFLGAIVGSIAVAIIGPIYSLTDQISAQ